MTDLQNNIETRSMLPVGTVLNGKYRYKVGQHTQFSSFYLIFC